MRCDDKVIKVDGIVRLSIPEEDEYITDVLNPEAISHIVGVRAYRRSREECPFNRGNVVIDITLDNNEITCLKLPLDTPDEIVERYLSPLNKIVTEEVEDAVS